MTTPKYEGRRLAGVPLEAVILELFKRVLVQLGYSVLDASHEPAGSQRGKDLQLRWRDPDGRQGLWQVECKGKTSKPLSLEDVAGKLAEVADSGHDIDVWCVVAPHVEAATALRDHVDRENARPHPHFHIALVAEGIGPFHELLATEPDLYQRVYSVPPEHLDPEEALRRRNVFRVWVEEATAAGRRKAIPAGWQLLEPARMELGPNSSELAQEFLRGLIQPAPWAAIEYGWAIRRNSALDGVESLLAEAKPGVSSIWLVGAGGEGKTTLLRQLAWAQAKAERATVLWTGAGSQLEGVDAPVDWIDGLPDGTWVLLCVDGSRKLSSADALVSAAHRWRIAGKVVVVVLTDRAHAWRRSRARVLMRVALTRQPQELDALAVDEAETLAKKLQDLGILHNISMADAVARITRDKSDHHDGRPWLLPTLMQLTDPHGRGFEQILSDVLHDLATSSGGASRLLLAIAVAHSAGVGMPRYLAARLVEDQGGLGEVMPDLVSELQKHWLHPRTSTHSALAGEALYTHHQVVAEGLLEVGAASVEHKDMVLEICASIPAVVRPEVTEDALIPKPIFDGLLDPIADYLREAGYFELAVENLLGIYRLDERQFPALHRCGLCYSDWFYSVARSASRDEELARWLYRSALQAYQDALAAVESAFAEPELVPRPYRGLDPDHERRYSYHGIAVLYSRAGAVTNRRSLLLRSLAWALLAFSPASGTPRGRAQVARVYATLAESLISLGSYDLAARAAAASAALDHGRLRPSIAHRLAEVNIELPEGGLKLIPGVLVELCTGPLLHDYEILRFANDEARRAAFAGVLRAAISWFPRVPELRDSAEALTRSAHERPRTVPAEGTPTGR